MPDGSCEFYRYYYFIVTVLNQPERGFNLTDISYDYSLLETALDKLGALINPNEMKSDVLFTNLNEYALRKLFLNGLWAEAEARTVPEIRTELDYSRHLDEDVNFINVTSALK